MARTSAKTNTPAKLEEGAVPVALLDNMEAEAGAGFEDAGADDFSIPFISLLQKGSPQCDEDSDGFVEGAKPGMFWDSGAMSILCHADGTPMETIKVTPIVYERKYNQWKDRDSGGGFVATHAPDADILTKAVRDERGRLVLNDDTHLMDTRQFFVMLYAEDMASARPAIIGMSSTQIKKGRQWMTRMAEFKVDGKTGKFNPPMYGQIWELGQVGESNAKGNWKGWKIGEPELVSNSAVFEAAKSFRESIQSGAIQVAAPPQGAGETQGSEAPYDPRDGAAY